MKRSSFLRLADVLTFRGAQHTNSEKPGMDKKPGDWSASIIANLETSESGPQPMWTSSDTGAGQVRDTVTFNLVSSRDLGDPEMGTVLHWHLERCAHCSLGSKLMPPPFGVRDPRHCEEYWGIIDEYREYEVIYAMRGNP